MHTKKNNIFTFNNLLIYKMLLIKKDQILIALSGGQDSIYLLNILYVLSKKWNWKLVIMYCDHGWTLKSKLQALQIYYISKKLKISFYQSVSIYTIKKEQYAREWRYNILRYVSIYHNYKVLLTAHTSTDRMETFFYNLIRGSGINGLQALNWEKMMYIYPSIKYKSYIKRARQNILIPYLINTEHQLVKLFNTNLRLIRPLLNFTRNDISKSLSIEFPLLFDNSNSNIILKRNRIRNRIFPYIKLYYNSQVEISITKITEIFCNENLYFDLLNKTILKRLRMNIRYKDSPIIYACLYINIFIHLPIAFQRRLLYYFLNKHLFQNLDFEIIESIRLLCLNSIKFEKKNIKNQYFIKTFTYSYIHIILREKTQLKILNRTMLCIFQ